jgi:glycerophosphoryl diester phosphodiesterase
VGTRRPLIIAHRGASGDAPENTLAAFRLAARHGADMIELDIRMTRDGALVVFHDRRLGRTARGWRPVRDSLLTELREKDAGRWFSARFAGEMIPLLAEILQNLRREIGINIEVKTDGDKRRRTMLAVRLAELLRHSGRTLLVSSFDHVFLRKFHTIAPGLPLGTLLMPVRDARRRPSVITRKTGATMFICSIAQLRRRHMRDAREAGLGVMVYGVTRPRQFRKALRAGVDGIITNHPLKMRKALRTLPARDAR